MSFAVVTDTHMNQITSVMPFAIVTDKTHTFAMLSDTCLWCRLKRIMTFAIVTHKLMSLIKRIMSFSILTDKLIPKMTRILAFVIS